MNEGRVEYITEFTLSEGGRRQISLTFPFFSLYSLLASGSVSLPQEEKVVPVSAKSVVSAVRAALVPPKDTPPKKETPAERLKRLSREMLEKKSRLFILSHSTHTLFLFSSVMQDSQKEIERRREREKEREAAGLPQRPASSRYSRSRSRSRSPRRRRSRSRSRSRSPPRRRRSRSPDP
jgi:hypothetical protein